MIHSKISEIMSEDIVKVTEDASVQQAAHIMLRFRINGLIVVKNDNKNILAGIVTTTDLLKLLDEALSATTRREEELERVGQIPVSSVYSRDVVSLQKDDKLEKAIAIMHRKNIHTIPIYEGERLVGVIGRHDILNRAYYKEE